MHASETFHPSRLEKWITIGIWALALLLMITRPWQVSAFGLNTEIFMFSTFGPAWAFLLVCLLAGLLRMMRRPLDAWKKPARIAFALSAALLFSIPQIDLIMMYLESYQVRFPPQSIGPMRAVLLWATPLGFFWLPAAPLICGWIGRNKKTSTIRALGIALLIFGIVYIPFSLMVNRLLIKYTLP